MRRRNAEDGLVHDERMEETFEAFSRLANQKKLSVPRTTKFSRQDVVDAFQDAFELVGGIPRLATWAHENYGEFAKLYARLLPAQAMELMSQGDQQIKLIYDIPPGPLDEPNPEFINQNSTVEIGRSKNAETED